MSIYSYLYFVSTGDLEHCSGILIFTFHKNVIKMVRDHYKKCSFITAP